MSRQCQSTWYAPFESSQSETQAGGGLIYDACPFCEGMSESVIGNSFISTLVIILFSQSSPSDIPRFVMTFVIDAVKRIFGRWSSPKFVQELFIGFKQKLNAASSIPIVVRSVRVITSASSSFICGVFRRFITFAVDTLTFRCGFGFAATARLGMAVSQPPSKDASDRAAITLAIPILLTCVSKYSQLAILMPCEIEKVIKLRMWCKNEFSNARILVGHFGSPVTDLIRVVRGSSLCQPFYSIT